MQCLGMRDPVLFSDIYQTTRLIVSPDPDDSTTGDSFHFDNRLSRSTRHARAFDEQLISVDEFLWRDQDAVIRSGPGWGKTTLMHYIYRSTLRNDALLPVLITLRRPTAVSDLEKYVSACSKIQKTANRACTLLLVDGYDEISTQDQRRVSEAILTYQGQQAGKFYLTCRDYYEISQLNAPEVRIDAFSRDDQVHFVDVFLTAYGCPHDPVAVVDELHRRGFDEFLEHPLLLTLACIVKTSPMTAQPRSGLRLLQKALNVLCYQWDEQKKISRELSTPLEGEDRIRILANIAYRSSSPFVKQGRAEEITRKQLALMRFDRIDARQVLMEIAKFYGILVPSEDGYDFVHRTIHDYLAAKQWVESGEFARARSHPWTARTAYAACIMSDATEVLREALSSPSGLPTAVEIISNAASFDMPTIAEALVRYFSEPGRVLNFQRVTHQESGRVGPGHDLNRITGQLDSDFVRWADSRFFRLHCRVLLRKPRARGRHTRFICGNRAVPAQSEAKLSDVQKSIGSIRNREIHLSRARRKTGPAWLPKPRIAKPNERLERRGEGSPGRRVSSFRLLKLSRVRGPTTSTTPPRESCLRLLARRQDRHCVPKARATCRAISTWTAGCTRMSGWDSLRGLGRPRSPLAQQRTNLVCGQTGHPRR